ncbi:MAG: transporter substrate-binding domain-containing protein, partial [Firmicutes bacterium]|nr:transporter substrate-binding domain-containing protein [Bacillota bacterium]
MKRIINFLIVVVFLSGFIFTGLLGCAREDSFDIQSITSYLQIPGAEQYEAQIDALRALNRTFTFKGQLSTELFIPADNAASAAAAFDPNQYYGYAVNFCALLEQLFDLKITVEAADWDALNAGLEAEEIDFSGDFTPTAVRQWPKGKPVTDENGDPVWEEDEYGELIPAVGKGFIMSQPIAERLLRIFTVGEDGHLTFRTEADLNSIDITVGFLSDTTTAGEIKSAYPLDFKTAYFSDYAPAVDALLKGDIDAFIDEATADADPFLFTNGHIRSSIAFPLVHSSVSLTTAREELRPLIDVIDLYIKAGGFDTLYELYSAGDFKYAQYKLFQTLGEDELAYLNRLQTAGNTVSVAYDRDDYPVSFYNGNNSEYEGVAVDVLARIGKLTGIRFECKTPADAVWEDILNDARKGNIQLLAHLLKTEPREKSGDFVWSEPYETDSYYALISKNTFPDLATYQVPRYKVGVMRGSGHEDIYNKIFKNAGNLTRYNSLEAALNALEKGQIDLLMGSEYVLLMQTNYREKPGYKINVMLVPLETRFGFSKANPDWQVLSGIVDEALAFVPTQSIELKWMGKSFDYAKKLADQRARTMTITMTALAVVLAVA